MSERTAAVLILLGTFAADVLGTGIVALAGGTPGDVTATFVLGGLVLGVVAMFPVMFVTS